MKLHHLLLLSFFLFLVEPLPAKTGKYVPQFEAIDAGSIQIARDKWGVPHIFAPTDAGAAYGLAWANAEDNFVEMQNAVLFTKGFGGRVKGKEGAAFDYYTHAINADAVVDELWGSHLSEDYIKYLDGYCQGINAYAAAHSNEVTKKKAFPITPRDIVRTFFVTFSAISGVPGSVENAVGSGFDNQYIEISNPMNLGSNAYAVGSGKTANGNTMFCTNPHFMIDGPMTFYEAHIQSDEGLDCAGALFQGGTSIFLGSNNDLGWGHTWNHFDKVDNYKLEMHPDKKLTYKFDGEWLELEKRPVWLKVKIGKMLRLPVRKMAYLSVYGPTFKSKGGNFYAVRAPSLQTIGAGEEWYRINKATNFKEFKAAIDMLRIAIFNIIYADKDGNLMYLHHGLFADRNDQFEWDKLITDNSKDSYWEGVLPISELQQVVNPSCDYIFNTNNTPMNASCEEANEKRSFPKWMDLRPGDNNRSERIMELLQRKNLLSFEDFKAIKYDNKYPQQSVFLKCMDPLFAMKPAEHPGFESILNEIHNWNRVSDTGSIGAAKAFLTMIYIFEKRNYFDGEFISGFELTEEDLLEALQYTKDFLIEHYGTLDVPLGSIQRFFRLGNDFPVQGFPDHLMANYAESYKDGKYKLKYGDTYIHFAEFSKNGRERCETLLPFATHKNVEKYDDHLTLYNQFKAKPMITDKEEVLKHAVQIYHPKP